MKEQKISLLVILLLMMNLFLEIIFIHNDIAPTNSEKISISEMTSNHNTEQDQEHAGHEHCASGVCHSGFCKLVNSFVSTMPRSPFYSEQYSNIQVIIPDSPYLMGNRRPPKSNT